MTSEGTYVEHGFVHLPDVNGFPRVIPVHAFEDVRRAANQSDAERAYYRSRFELVGAWFNRDALNGALGLINPDPCANCHEAPGVNDMGDGKHFCPGCCSAAQGSHYDDKDYLA